MEIASASIKLQSQHVSQRTTSRQESLQVRVGPPPQGNTRQADTDRVTLSAESLSAAASAAEADAANATDAAESDGLSAKDRLALNIVRHLFKVITGRDMVVQTPSELRQELQSGEVATGPDAPSPQGSPQNTPPASAGFGLAYDSVTTIHESEATSFSAAGIIKTADGREVQFSVQLNMSRAFSMEQRLSVRAGDPIKVDPLVVNFAGNAAELGNTHFEFDLDSDGDKEQISNLKAGSALLALDMNNNGTVDNGKELFGPNSGNGFQELARYDGDGNGFIDANDQVFDKLRLWMRDDSGGSKLVALGQVGIGAIYLGNVGTSFQLNDAQNRNLGQVASTGLFFREDGGVGTVQQVDYSV